jgi:HlyD family secretion protein
MNQDPLERLRISSQKKRRPAGRTAWIVIGVIGVIGGLVYFAVPRAADNQRGDGAAGAVTSKDGSGAGGSGNGAAVGRPSGEGGAAVENSVLSVSGPVVARERIEISPRFMGVVSWIGVRKGDTVTNGQEVVRLDDSEYRARLAENDGQRAVAQVALERAKVDLARAEGLVASRVEMQKLLDDARLAVASAEAGIQQVLGARRLLETWLEWCVIRSPVDGVVLERLVDANELVTPQSFGSGRGPSTSLLAVADLTDLQVEVDLGASSLARVKLGQRCVVRPDAYPDRRYEGEVAEMAPEANRQKGTLQVKVRILKPDAFLTPELNATVDFLGEK